MRNFIVQKLGLKDSAKWAKKKLSQGYILKHEDWGTQRILMFNDQLFTRSGFEDPGEEEVLHQANIFINLASVKPQYFPTKYLSNEIFIGKPVGWKITGKVTKGYPIIERTKGRTHRELLKEIKEAEKKSKYVCKCCGSRHEPSYNGDIWPIDLRNWSPQGDIYNKMKSNSLCFTCAMWLNRSELDMNLKYIKPVIAKGGHYSYQTQHLLDDNTPGGVKLEVLSTGEIIRVKELHFQGDIPEFFQQTLLPDTHRILL